MYPRVSKLTSLLGSASLLAMAGAGGAFAQGQTQTAQAGPAELPEQVLITGSLIRGAASVGVPVTNVGPQDFVVSGALTTADLFKTIPAFVVTPGAVGTNNGGNIARENSVNLRGLDSVGGYPVRSLMMVDGYRVPPQGEHSGQRDPSIIPALAIDRVDVLANGASATYGSDAVSGVMNILLKRGYDGAVTQLRTTLANGKTQYQASQLWGRTWDGGDITLTYEWSDSSPLKGKDRSNFTTDFSPWGLDNRTPIASSIPATISVGVPAPSSLRGLGTGCTNCFAIPAGAGVNFNSSLNSGLGPLAPSSAAGLLNWATIGVPANGGATNSAAGTANEINPYSIGWYDAAQQHNSAVLTVDQRLTRDVSFYGEGYYSNRRAEFLNLANQSPASTQDLQVQVPTRNPYYPIGAPTNLVVNYNIGLEVPPFTNSSELADRYLLGLNLDLPGDWQGRIYYSETFNGTRTNTNAVNPNAASAALGWTIPAGFATGTAPAIGTWTKPATLPYLNLFCDPRSVDCNSQSTLDYITGRRLSTTSFWFNEKGVNFDGPLFSLPAGDVKAAVGATYTSERWLYSQSDNTKVPSLLTPLLQESKGTQFWAIFAQLNVPIVGESNSIPLINGLEVEASWRHDQYSDVGGTSNPKIGFNWTISRDIGLFVRGDWGTSFRAPSFAEQSAIVGNIISGINIPGFVSNRTVSLDCSAGSGSLTDRLLNPGPGYVGWAGVVGNAGTARTTCGARANPSGLGTFSTGGVALKDGFRNYVNTAQAALRPETATNYTLTGEFAPTNFLKGLDLQVTWYQVKISNALTQFGNPSNSTVNNSALGFSYILPTDIAKAGIDVAGCSNNNTPSTCPEFERMVSAVLSDPQNAVPPGSLTSILWINDGAIGNFGWIKLEGIDFNASYDYDAGDLGVWNAGITGTYYLHEYEVNNPTTELPNPPLVDDFHTDAGTVGGVSQEGATTAPRMRYRARLGWSNGPWSATGFVNYIGHYYNTQNAPPNVNLQCLTAGGTVGGGTLPCAISNYTGLEPSYYTFDFSIGYTTGDLPANDYLKNVGIQFVVQNLMNKLPPFEYQIAAGSAPTAFDVSKNDLGRTFSLILTKAW
jgi:outer membrane receptor protein involved in Fe transport